MEQYLPEQLLQVVAAMEHYLKTVLEIPHSSFGGKAPCPFAKREREEDKIEYQLCEITPGGPSDRLVRLVKDFRKQDRYSTLLVVDPVKRVSVERLVEIGLEICEQSRTERMIAIGLHPDDPFSIHGFRMRCIPYVTLVGQQADYLKWAKDRIRGSAYYSHWTAAALEYNAEQIGKFL